MKNIRGTAACWADILANLLATVRCLGPPTLFVTLSADDNYWPELKLLLQNITYEEATRNSSANEQMRKDPLLTSLHPVGGALPKNIWRVCAATLTPISNRLSLNDPLFIFHILLSRNDPHFQNALSLNDPLFLEIFIGENGRHALTEWRPFSKINDHLVICTQYLFGRRDLCSC